MFGETSSVVAGFIPARALFIIVGVRFIAAQKRAEYRTDRIIFTWVMDRNKTIKKLASADPAGVNKPKAKRPWYLTLINLLLLILLVYLGRQTVRQVRNAGVEPGAIAAAIPVFTGTIPAVEAAVRPLIDYRNIWKRKYRYHDQSPPPHHSNKSEYRMTYHSLNSRISFLV